MDLDLAGLQRFAKMAVAAGDLLPEHVTKGHQPAVAIARASLIVQAGQELGLPPMTALRGLMLVKGKITLSADLMLSLMISRAGCAIEWVQNDDKGAVLKLQRPGHGPYTSSFTTADAKRAGLTGGNWSKYPAAMLRARCVSAAARAYCPDVLQGVYVPGELPGSEEPEPQRVQVESAPEPREAAPALGQRDDLEETPQRDVEPVVLDAEPSDDGADEDPATTPATGLTRVEFGRAVAELHEHGVAAATWVLAQRGWPTVSDMDAERRAKCLAWLSSDKGRAALDEYRPE